MGEKSGLRGKREGGAVSVCQMGINRNWQSYPGLWAVNRSAVIDDSSLQRQSPSLIFGLADTSGCPDESWGAFIHSSFSSECHGNQEWPCHEGHALSSLQLPVAGRAGGSPPPTVWILGSLISAPHLAPGLHSLIPQAPRQARSAAERGRPLPPHVQTL